MTEDSLWKLAALTYQRDVVEPAKAEGAPVPPWGWKDVRNHYEIHSMSNLIHRHKQLRCRGRACSSTPRSCATRAAAASSTAPT